MVARAVGIASRELRASTSRRKRSSRTLKMGGSREAEIREECRGLQTKGEANDHDKGGPHASVETPESEFAPPNECRCSRSRSSL